MSPLTKPQDVGAAKKRRRLWYYAAAGAVIVLVVVIVLANSFRGKPGPPAAEKKILDALIPYGARYEMDEDRHVVRIMLEGKDVTDEALDKVRDLPRLTRLSLRESAVTDAGMIKLSGLKRLQNLGITGTKVTDRGLGYLAQMPSLRDIWVCKNAKLTDRGIATLRRALPGTTIHVMNEGAKKPRDKESPSKGEKQPQ